MNIRDTKPGHIYGVSSYNNSRYRDAENGVIFAVKALALEGQYERANPNYWSSSNGKANGLTVEIQETVLDGVGEPCNVLLPGMGERVEVKEGNVVVISGRCIQWSEDAYRAVKERIAERKQRYEEQREQDRAKAKALKDRIYAAGLGELDDEDEDEDLANWYPPDISTFAEWDEFLTILEARQKVTA